MSSIRGFTGGPSIKVGPTANYGAVGLRGTPETIFNTNARDLVPSIGTSIGARNEAGPTELRSFSPPGMPTPGDIHGSNQGINLATRSTMFQLQQTAFTFVTVLRDVLSSKKTNMLKFVAPLVTLAPGQTMISMAQIRIRPAEYDETVELVPPQTFGFEFGSESRSVKMYNLGFHQEHLFKLGGNFATEINRMLIESMQVAMLNTIVHRACDMLMLQPVYMQALINMDEPAVLSRRSRMLEYVFIASRDQLGMAKVYHDARAYFTRIGVSESVPMWIMTASGAIEQTMIKEREWMYNRGYFTLPLLNGISATGPVENAIAYLLTTPGTIPFLGELNAALFTVEPMTLVVDNRRQASYQAQTDTQQPFTGPYSIGEVYLWENVRAKMACNNPAKSPIGNLFVSIFSRPELRMEMITVRDACEQFILDLENEDAGVTAKEALKQFLDVYLANHKDALDRVYTAYNQKYLAGAKSMRPGDDKEAASTNTEVEAAVEFGEMDLNAQFKWIAGTAEEVGHPVEYTTMVFKGLVVPYFLPIVYRPALTLHSTTIATGVSGGTHESTSLVLAMGDSEWAVGGDANRFLEITHHRFTGAIIPLQNRLICTFPAAVGGGYRRGGGHMPIKIEEAVKIMSDSYEEAAEAFLEDRSVWFVPYPITHLIGRVSAAFPFVASGQVPSYLGLADTHSGMAACPFSPYITAFGNSGVERGGVDLSAQMAIHEGLGTWVVPGYHESGEVDDDGRATVGGRHVGSGPCAGYGPDTFNNWEAGLAHDPATRRTYKPTISEKF